MKLLIIYLIIINFITFFIYGIDKLLACKKLYRISEKTFFIFSFIGGCFSSILAMKFFHHKTHKFRFYFINILGIIIYIILISIIWRNYGFK